MSDNKTQYYNDLNQVDSKSLYNQLPEYTRIARYAQYNKNKKRRETWEEQTNRVFNMHKVKFAKYLDNEKFMEYFNFAKLHVLNKNVLGSQRALQFGGPSILNKNTRIYNCAATYINRVKAFQEVMFTLLCGVGMGFSVQTHHITKLPNIKNTQDVQKIYKIPDSIEGWSDAIAVLVSSYFTDNQPFPEYFNYDISFDFSLIRPAGSKISNIGGKAPGPDGLKSALQKIKEVFNNCISQGFDKLRPIDAYDIIVHSSDAVLSGGVRRCIGKGSLVLTRKESFKPIENIQKGDFVSTNDGWKEVTNTFVQGKQKTIKITHSNGELICTPNHRVAVLKFNNFEWKEAGNLKYYDKLLYVEPKIDEKDKINILPKFPNIIMPPFDIEIAWLLGNIQCNQKRFYDYINVYEKNNQEEQLNFIKKQLEKFDINYINNEKLSTFFGLLLKNNIPKCVLQGTNTIKFAYIQGILDSNNNQYLKPEFLKDIQNLLYSLGIVSHFKKNCIKDLIISNCHIDKLNRGCSFGWNKIHKTNSYNIENLFIPIYISIKSIEEYEEVETYDIEVKDNHNFMCEGVLVHNSATLCLFSLEDTEMISAKTGDWYIKNPQRARSNNSVLLLRDNTPEEKYMNLITSVKQFGEPGIIWTDNTETLYNPCVEISLYGYDKNGNSGIQMCNLSEINMATVNTETDFYSRCKAASILGTFQASYTDFGYLGKITQDIVEREALIGVSMTGMMENPSIAFNPEILEKGATIVKNINEELAKIIGINKASRTTCIKPAGCLVGESIVITNKGLLHLNEIGDINGEQWQEIKNINIHTQSIGENAVSKFYVNGKKPTKIITTETGLEIQSTLNHKFRVYNIKTHRLEWKETENLECGDILPYMVNTCKFFKDKEYVKLESVPDIKGRNFYKKPIECPTYLTEDIAWLIGLYIGDGSNHINGIRIAGNKDDLKTFEKSIQIIKNNFNFNASIIEDKRQGKRTSLYFSSRKLLKWLDVNKLSKNKSLYVEIPLKIRQSSVSVMKAFIDGYWEADGSMVHKKISRNLRTWCTISKKMAFQLLNMLRYIGQDCSIRLMPPTENSLGNNMRYWIAEKKGWTGQYKNAKYNKYFEEFKEYNYEHFTPDIIKNIVYSSEYTYDIEVPNGSEYTINSISSHNSTSCILGSSSGIHPCHADRYFRRVQSNNLEETLKFFKKYNPQAVETSVWSSGKTDDVITFLCKSKPGALTKVDVLAIDLLEKVKLVQKHWVTTGRNLDVCVQPWLNHNVSNTITIKDTEWELAAKFIYDNRQFFAGISMLGDSGDMTYHQAPFQAVYTHEMIAKIYGAGSIFASGLIVHANNAFNNNLYSACATLLGYGEKLKMPDLNEDSKVSLVDSDKIYKKIRWVAQAKKFSKRHFNYDDLKMTYCLKAVDAWKTWCDLKRTYKTVPWEEFIEEDDNTKPTEYVACSGNSCEIIKF